MKDIVITSDSTCDLSRELIAENGIAIMPLSVTLGGKTYKDGIDIVPADIFRYFDETGELPKTAAPSVEEYEQMFRSFTTAAARSSTSTSRPRRAARMGSRWPRRKRSAETACSSSIRTRFLPGRACS